MHFAIIGIIIIYMGVISGLFILVVMGFTVGFGLQTALFIKELTTVRKHNQNNLQKGQGRS
jgi:hypothetical protein